MNQITINTTSKIRIRAKQFFLTYPKIQAGAKEIAENLIKNIQDLPKLAAEGVQVKEILVCKEGQGSSLNDFQDTEELSPQQHAHVYMSLSQVVDIYGSTFTLRINNVEYKGNYQRVINRDNVVGYILKSVTKEVFDNLEQNADKIYVNEGLKQQLDFGEKNGKISLTNKSFDHKLIELAEAGKVQEAIELYKQEKPGQYVRYGKSIENGLNYVWLKTLGVQTKFKLSDYHLPPMLCKLLYNLRKSKQTIFIVGPTNTGKTQLLATFLQEALGLSAHEIAWVGKLTDGLRVVGHQTKVIVMDDCNFSALSREELLSILDTTHKTTVNIKGSSAVLRQDVGRVALSNKHPHEYSAYFQDPAVAKRMCVIRVADMLHY